MSCRLQISRQPLPGIGSNVVSERYETVHQKEKKVEGKKISLNLDGITLKQLVTYLIDTTECTIIYNEELSDKKVSMRVVEQTLEEVLDIASRKLSVNLIKVRGMYFIGQATNKDRVSYITRLERYKPDQAKEIINSMVSDVGKVSVLEDGNIIVVDYLSVIEQIKDTLEQINEQQQSIWMLYIDVAMFQEEKNKQYGVELNNIIEDAITYSTGHQLNAQMDLVLKGALRMEDNVKYLETKNLTSVILQDGKKQKLMLGQRYPVQQTQYTNSGASTVQMQNVSYQDIGLTVESLIKQMSDREKASVSVSYELSDIIGLDRSNNPIIQTYKQDLDLTVIDGGRYVLANVVKDNNTTSVDKFINVIKSTKRLRMYYILTVKRIR